MGSLTHSPTSHLSTASQQWHKPCCLQRKHTLADRSISNHLLEDIHASTGHPWFMSCTVKLVSASVSVSGCCKADLWPTMSCSMAETATLVSQVPFHHFMVKWISKGCRGPRGNIWTAWALAWSFSCTDALTICFILNIECRGDTVVLYAVTAGSTESKIESSFAVALQWSGGPDGKWHLSTILLHSALEYDHPRIGSTMNKCKAGAVYDISTCAASKHGWSGENPKGQRA